MFLPSPSCCPVQAALSFCSLGGSETISTAFPCLFFWGLGEQCKVWWRWSPPDGNSQATEQERCLFPAHFWWCSLLQGFEWASLVLWSVHSAVSSGVELHTPPVSCPGHPGSAKVQLWCWLPDWSGWGLCDPGAPPDILPACPHVDILGHFGSQQPIQKHKHKIYFFSITLVWCIFP